MQSSSRCPMTSNISAGKIPMKSDMSLERRDFLRMIGVGVTVAVVPASMVGCGSDDADGIATNDAWEALAATKERGGVYTTANPGKWAGKEALHVPRLSWDGVRYLTVEAKHPMTSDHWITVIYIRNQDGIVIGLQEFSGTDPAAKVVFSLPNGTTGVTAFAHCNLHDDWSTTTV